MTGLPPRRGVQVLRLPGTVVVRDGSGPAGPELRFTPAEWAAFTASLKRNPSPAPMGRVGFADGRLDLPPLPRRRPPPFVDPPT